MQNTTDQLWGLIDSITIENIVDFYASYNMTVPSHYMEQSSKTKINNTQQDGVAAEDTEVALPCKITEGETSETNIILPIIEYPEAENIIPSIKFYHRAICKFSDTNTHRTDLGRGTNDQSGQRAFHFNDYNEFVRSGFVAELMRRAGDNFFLNEYNQDTPLPMRFFMDIDIALSPEIIIDIKGLISELFVDPDVLILQNTSNKKLHIITNAPQIPIPNVAPEHHRALIGKMIKNIAIYLYEECEPLRKTIPGRDWLQACDGQATMSLRSPYSIKVKNGICESRGFYVPFGADISADIKEKVQIIHDYSIYRPATTDWNENQIFQAEIMYNNILQHHSENVEGDSYSGQKSIQIGDNIIDITAAKVNELIGKLPKFYLKGGTNGGSWQFLLRKLKNIAAVVKYDTSYFLHEWSAQDKEQYNHDGNENAWRRFKGDAKYGPAAMKWLVEMVDKYNKPIILDGVICDEKKYNMEGLMKMIDQIDNEKIRNKFDPHIFDQGYVPRDITNINLCDMPGLDQFIGEHDALIVRSPMGTGKSKRLREFIANTSANVIFISFRQSFTSDICAKMPGFVDYRNVPAGQIKDRRVVVQYESVHRLKIYEDEPYILILDESESIISQSEGPSLTRYGTYAACWEKLSALLNNSDLVIALDAMTGRRTFSLLSHRHCVMVDNKYKIGSADSNGDVIGEKQTDMYYADLKNWNEKLFETIPKCIEEPIIIAVSKKKTSHELYKYCKAHIPAGAVIKLYNGDSTAEERKDFENFSAVLDDVHILIYTSTVSAGLSYENPRFVHRFARFSPYKCDVISAIQMMGRVRSVSSRTNHIVIDYNGVREYAPTSYAEVCKMLETVTGAKQIGRGFDPIRDLRSYVSTFADQRVQLSDHPLYRMHVENVLARCRSDRFFIYLFSIARQKSGIKIVGQNFYEVAEQTKENLTELNQISVDIREQNILLIAAAEIPSESRAAELQEKMGLSPGESAELAKYNMAGLYGIDRGIADRVIDDKFVRKYKSTRAKTVWQNLRRLSGMDLTQHALDAVTKLQKDSKGTLRDEAEAVRTMRVCAAVDVLVRLFGDNIANSAALTDYFSNKYVRYIAKILLEEKILDVCKYIEDNSAVFDRLFEIRTRPRSKARNSFKARLGLVNSVISAAFDVEILLDRKDREMYYLHPSQRYTYSDGEWVLAVYIPSDSTSRQLEDIQI